MCVTEPPIIIIAAAGFSSAYNYSEMLFLTNDKGTLIMFLFC